MFCCFSWEKSTKCSQNPGSVNEFSAPPRGQLNWTGPIANSSKCLPQRFGLIALTPVNCLQPRVGRFLSKGPRLLHCQHVQLRVHSMMTVAIWGKLLYFNSVQTRCIVKGDAQKNQLFWRFLIFSGAAVLWEFH